MSATLARPATVTVQAACEQIRDGLRLQADGWHTLSLCDLRAPGPRPVASGREPEVLLTIEQAQELLGGCSHSHIERLIAGKPCRRKAGRKVLVERAGLLALLKRG